MTQQAKVNKRSQGRHRMEVCGRFADGNLSRAKFADGEGMPESTLHNWLVRPEIRAALGERLSARSSRRTPRAKSSGLSGSGLVEVMVKSAAPVSNHVPDVSLTLVAVTFKSMPSRAQLREVIGAMTEC